MERSTSRSHCGVRFRTLAGLILVCVAAIATGDDGCMSSDTEAIGFLVVAEQSTLVDHTGRRSVATANTCVRVGAELATGRNGRVVMQLRADPESDSAAAKIHLGPNSSLTLKRDHDRARILELIDGWLQFFSGRPAKIDVDARYITAGVRGTEFTLFSHNNDCPVYAPVSREGCSALWVQSGSVAARKARTPYNDPSTIRVSRNNGGATFDGQTSASDNGVVAYAGQPPRRARLKFSPENAADWVVYYPPLLHPADQACRTGFSTFDAARPQESVRCATAPAFAAIVDDIKRMPDRFGAASRTQAALRLMRESDIDGSRALLINAVDAEGLALRSLIALKANERMAKAKPGDESLARVFARRAIVADPKSVNAHLALSYVEQAEFDIEGAQTATREAARLSNAAGAASQVLIKARLAELSLADQDTLRALTLANEAVCIASAEECPDRYGGSSSAHQSLQNGAPISGPILSRALSVRGFVNLVARDIRAAEHSFRRSIAADGFSPLARFGLGLVLIRNGQLDDGVDQLELAVTLDPEVSLYRSYLGKGYFEQNDFERADKQLAFAKMLDPDDPTPWLYQALLANAENDPVGAIYALGQSRNRNEQRAVYRSRLLLDSDEAVRGTGLGQVYQDLGFDELARLEATRSLQVDPGNYSAHRLLTDANARHPRFEIARVSDLLQARMRAPRVQHPVSAQLADTRVGNAIGNSAFTSGVNEYSRLFARDGMSLSTMAMLGSKFTFEEEIAFSWAEGPYSAAITQYHYETDGFRPKHAEDKDYWNLLAQYRLSSATSIQFDYRNLDFDHGTNFWGFDPTDYYPDDINDSSESWRLGVHHVITPNIDIVAFSHREQASLTIDDGFGSFLGNTEEAGVQHEAQLTGRWGNANIVAGAAWYERDRDDDQYTPFGFTISTMLDSSTRHRNAYAYLTVNTNANETARQDQPMPSASFTLGAAYEYYDSETKARFVDFPNTVFNERDDLQRKRALPKLGLLLDLPAENGLLTTVRAAYFQTVKRALIGNQTLEPTSVAGFNQFYDDPEASLAKVTGLGVDFASPARTWFGGVEAVDRDLNLTEINIAVSPFAIATHDTDEVTYSAYLNWLPSRDWLFGARFEHEVFDRDDASAGSERIVDLDTERLRLQVRHVMDNRVSLLLEPSWIRQKGTFYGLNSNYDGSDKFWILNASARYRLPGRNGEVSVAVNNLFDTSYQYQDTDPRNPRYTPERAIHVRAVFDF